MPCPTPLIMHVSERGRLCRTPDAAEAILCLSFAEAKNHEGPMEASVMSDQFSKQIRFRREGYQSAP